MPCNEKFFNATGGRYGLEVDYYLASGPFYLSKWNHDASLILYKNDDYIAKEEVIPSGVILYVQSGEKTIAEEVKDDKLSAALISSINSGELKPKKQQITSYSGETWGFLINGGYSFAFSSKDLRRAFMLAINIDYAALEENAVPAKGVIPEVCLLGGENYRAKAGNITAPKTNTAMAKALWDKELKALGLKTFEVTVMCTERDEALVRAVIGQWQEVFGISFSAKIDVAPIEDIMDSVNSAGYQIAFAPVSAATSRTDDILKMFLNGYGVYSQSYGDLVKNALSAGKGEKLNAAKKCERFLIDNAFVYPVVSRNEVFALSPECADITYSEYLGSPIFEKGQRYD